MSDVFNIHAAKTQLSQLVDRAAKGEAVTIAKAGKPLVRLVAIGKPAKTPRIGFLKGHGKVPPADVFNSMADSDIAAIFEGDA